jgi:hypothetical protein
VALLVTTQSKTISAIFPKMNETRRLFQALENLISIDTIAPLKWNYEKERARGKIFLPPPSPELSKGEFQLGKVIWNETSIGNFGLEKHELPQHISIFGRTGSGKTNCAVLLIKQLQNKNIPFLIFDWKQSYRHLAQHQSSVQLYTPGYSQFPFNFNPLDLSNIPEQSKEAYLRQLLSVLLNVYFRDLKLLSVEGVEYLLLRGFDYLKKEKGSFTFFDLYHWISQYKTISREKDWKASVLNILYKLTTGPLGEVLNQDQSISIEEILKGKTILELHWLGSPKDKNFLMQALLLQLYYFASQETSQSNNLKFLILIEEAHNILLKHLEDYETVAEIILRQIREYGIGICLLDQHPSLMSLPALGTYTTICFNIRTREDIRAMESALSLEGDRDYLNKLRIGQGIVKLQDRCLKPFLVQFPKAEISKASYLPTTEVISPERTKRRVISHPDKLFSKEAKKLLIDMYKRPLIQTAQRYRDLNLNPRKGNALKRELLQKYLIYPIKINTGKGRISLFDLSEQGKQLLRVEGIEFKRAKRKGSLLHQYWTDQAKKYFQNKSYGILEEIKIGEGKFIDLVGIKGQEIIAIEIETGKSNFLENMKKCQEGNFERIIVVATSEKVKKEINKKIKDEEFKETPVVVVTGSEMIR